MKRNIRLAPLAWLCVAVAGGSAADEPAAIRLLAGSEALLPLVNSTCPEFIGVWRDCGLFYGDGQPPPACAC